MKAMVLKECCEIEIPDEPRRIRDLPLKTEPLEKAELPEPVPDSEQILVKVSACGICHTELDEIEGRLTPPRFPIVLGHEIVGTVEAMGPDVTNFKVGDRVTVPFVGGCGSCYQCNTGNHQVCDHQSQPGFTHWGSFAEYTKLDYADVNLVRLPEQISDETASILGCRFITSFRAVVEQGDVKGGETVAVHGCGGIGLSAIMIAHALGARVIAIDINEEALKKARGLGASDLIHASASRDIVGEIKELTQGGAHVSLDALGHTETCFNSIASLRACRCAACPAGNPPQAGARTCCSEISFFMPSIRRPSSASSLITSSLIWAGFSSNSFDFFR